MVATKMLGRSRDGGLTICQAKPENVGKGNCTHVFHFEAPADKVNEIISRDLEKMFEKRSLKAIKKKDREEKQKKKQKIVEEKYKSFYTSARRVEIDELKQQYLNKDYSFVQDFRSEMKNLIQEAITNNDSPEKYIARYLDSDKLLAKKVKQEFDGNHPTEEIAKLLCNPPHSMSSKSRNQKLSISRLMTAKLEKSMTKDQYVESVIYFGGKCCYCGKYLETHNDNSRKATGEHITPLSPEDLNKEGYGSNRFGNTALCCDRCNHNKGNKSFQNWIMITNTIKAKKKNNIIAKIEAFREVAGYRNFSQEFSQKVSSSLAAIVEEDTKKIQEEPSEYKNSKQRVQFLKDLINEHVSELNNYENKYVSFENT